MRFQALNIALLVTNYSSKLELTIIYGPSSFARNNIQNHITEPNAVA